MVAEDAAGIGVADQCRHLLLCFAESRKHSTFEGFHGPQTCPVGGGVVPTPTGKSVTTNEDALCLIDGLVITLQVTVHSISDFTDAAGFMDKTDPFVQ